MYPYGSIFLIFFGITAYPMLVNSGMGLYRLAKVQKRPSHQTALNSEIIDGQKRSPHDWTTYANRLYGAKALVSDRWGVVSARVCRKTGDGTTG